MLHARVRQRIFPAAVLLVSFLTLCAASLFPVRTELLAPYGAALEPEVLLADPLQRFVWIATSASGVKYLDVATNSMLSPPLIHVAPQTVFPLLRRYRLIFFLTFLV